MNTRIISSKPFGCTSSTTSATPSCSARYWDRPNPTPGSQPTPFNTTGTADPAQGSRAIPEEEVAEILPSGVLKETDSEVEVRIATVVEKLQYDVKEFTVKAGKTVKLTFANPDFLPHNFVVVQPGAADEVGNAAILLGAEGFEKDWLPQSDQILAASKLLDHRGEELLEFEAPEQAGDYPFVCTFPGHHLLMRGLMKVR